MVYFGTVSSYSIPPVEGKSVKEEEMLKKRSLYQCFNAKVLNTEIHCSKGHRLGGKWRSGNIHIYRLGQPLELSCCQNCQDYDEMGEPVEKGDRGWEPSFEELQRWRKGATFS